MRNVTADPWAGVCHDELFDTTPYAGAYVRYFVRHPTTQLMPRKVKTAFTGSDTDRALTGIHDVAFIARERDGVARLRDARRRRHVDHAARRADADRLRRRRRRRVPQVHRGRPAHLRPPGLAARQPRPRAASRCWSTRSASRRCASRSRRSSQGDWVAERDFSIERRALRLRRGGARARRRRPPTARRTATVASSSASARRTSSRSARRASRPSRSRSPAATSRPSSSAGSRRSCASTRGGFARTTVHQNFLLRWVRDEAVYDVWRAAGRARARRRGRRPDQRRRLVPRHGLLQARHHELDGAQPAPCRSGSSR